MCYGWYEEVLHEEALLAERMRLARQKADRRSTEPRAPAPEGGKERKPKPQTETQPDAVPA